VLRCAAAAAARALSDTLLRPQVKAILGTEHAHRFVLEAVSLDLPELQVRVALAAWWLHTRAAGAGAAWKRVAARLRHKSAASDARCALPPPQGEPEEVATAKARLAAKRLGCAATARIPRRCLRLMHSQNADSGPALVEDTSLCFNALGGLPGVYIKWFLEKCGHDGLNRMLAGFPDKSAYAQCIFAYAASPDAPPLLFVGRTAGQIVPARGDTAFGWDPVFLPDGFSDTYAQMDKATKNSNSHRFRALDKLRDHLLAQTE
jgi:inosine triphosphate pyrophosphatase